MSIKLTSAVALVALAACSRHSVPGESGDETQKVVQLPAALRVARGLDTLSVELDPVMLANATVHVRPGYVLGVSYTARVSKLGKTEVLSERHGDVPGRGMDFGAVVWNTDKDDLPQPGKKYVVDMSLVLFETDVAPTPHWNPHAGHYRALVTRSLRQAEE